MTVQVLAVLLLMQLPANVTGKVAEDGPSAWALLSPIESRSPRLPVLA